MNKRLPNDIVKYINRKVARCVIIFVILESIAIGISILSWEYLATNTNIVFHICILFFLYIIPFFASGLPFKLIDKSWSGVVTEVFIKEETGTYTSGGSRSFPYVKNVIYLQVQKDNGKEVRVAAREFGIRSHAGFPVPNEGGVTMHLDEYCVGDRVYHFYGLKHNYIVKNKSEIIECVICGSHNPKERSDCLNCGYSLIKNK